MASIGFFDSGFGGLAILRDVVRELPQYNYLYLGDSARAPYGERSYEEIYSFTTQALDFMFKQGCNLVILACNTASSNGLRKIQQEFLTKIYPNKKVLGVLIPAAEAVVKITKNKQVGIIATKSTVRSGSFVDEIKKLNPKVTVYQKACPKLVTLVEAGQIEGKEIKKALTRYLKPLQQANIDTLVLGCTHFGLLEKEIQSIAGLDVTLVSEGPIIAKRLKDYLQRHSEIETRLSKQGLIAYFTTGQTSKFEKLGSWFMGKKITAKNPGLF